MAVNELSEGLPVSDQFTEQVPQIHRGDDQDIQRIGGGRIDGTRDPVNTWLAVWDEAMQLIDPLWERSGR